MFGGLALCFSKANWEAKDEENENLKLGESKGRRDEKRTLLGWSDLPGGKQGEEQLPWTALS